MKTLNVLFIIPALLLSACLKPGVIAEHVDPVEGELVKRLLVESCEIRYAGSSGRHKYNPKFISVLDIYDQAGDEGRVASLKIEGQHYRFAYNPITAMTRCRTTWSSLKGFATYNGISQILIAQGGKPEIYFERLIRARQELGNDRYGPFAGKTTLPLNVRWRGVGENLHGSLKETLPDISGHISVELPGGGGACPGSFIYTNPASAEWELECPNGLSANGEVTLSDTVHGRGKDSHERKITFKVGHY